MLAQRHADQRGPGAPNPLADMLGMHRGGPEGGRLGDYALNQEGEGHQLPSLDKKLIPLVALDQIMTALMENSNAHRPVAATEEVIKKLNHEVLEEGCAWLVCLRGTPNTYHGFQPPFLKRTVQSARINFPYRQRTQTSRLLSPYPVNILSIRLASFRG